MSINYPLNNKTNKVVIKVKIDRATQKSMDKFEPVRFNKSVKNTLKILNNK
ncbi:MAG: hypothetical protein GY714_09205 [Desulfobacterales bacterium]|nr:hypothetical protein [Desulfobacterales bacterium]